MAFFCIFNYPVVAVPLLADFHIDQIENLTQHSESKLLITSQKVYDAVSVLDKDRLIDIATLRPFAEAEGRETALTKAFKKADEEFVRLYPNGTKPDDVNFAEINMEDLALISYTSGSTGNPKGVMLPYRTFWSNTLMCIDTFPVPSASDKYMSILPMAHMYGFSIEFLFATFTGRPMYLLTRIPSPQVLLKAFADIKPFMVVTVPLIVEKLIQTVVFPELKTPKMQARLADPEERKKLYAELHDRLYAMFGGRFAEMIFGGAAVNREVDQFLFDINFPATTGTE